MSDEIRVNRPQVQQPQRPMTETQPDMGLAPTGSKMPWVILAVVVVIIVILGVLFRNQLFKGAGSPAMSGAPAGASGYEAVFLTNGQVYFGKLSDPDANYATLKDIYYLQVGPQQGSGTGTTTAPAQQSISLVKLGQELHGPVDEMHISRTQILFYEDLKSDGSVVKAINAYKANPTGAPSK